MKRYLLLILAFSFGAYAQKPKSGADKEVGWIIKKTKNGIVKIPKTQYFNFEGASIGGRLEKPPLSVLGSRRTPKRRSLIPIRQSFKKELLEAYPYPRANDFSRRRK